MSDRLREAAKVLREMATEARGGRWFSDGASVKASASWGSHDVAHCDGSLPEGNEVNAAYIAMVQPSVAVALADWLDALVKRADQVRRTLLNPTRAERIYPVEIDGWTEAQSLADLILGGTDD